MRAGTTGDTLRLMHRGVLGRPGLGLTRASPRHQTCALKRPREMAPSSARPKLLAFDLDAASVASGDAADEPPWLAYAAKAID